MDGDGKTNRHTYTHRDKVWSIVNFFKVAYDFENQK